MKQKGSFHHESFMDLELNQTHKNIERKRNETVNIKSKRVIQEIMRIERRNLSQALAF